MAPPIRYAVNDGVKIAYQIAGDGPIDVVYTPGIWSNLELMWDWPPWERYLMRLAAFARLILFDIRGVGLSDRGPYPPALELQTDDIGSVMDAAGSQSAALFGGARGATVAVLFAASHPERTRALVLYAPTARTLRADDWPYGRTQEEQDAFFDRFSREMGTAENLAIQAPGYEPQMKPWWARFERLTASPGAWRELAEILSSVDVRQVLPHIQAPTLVIHRTGDRIVDVAQGRAVAAMIPGARFVELAGDDHIPFVGDYESVTNEVQEFLTGSRPAPDTDRVLATVLFTDVVGSTEKAAALGDREWGRVLAAHHQLVRRALSMHRGVEVDSIGDGFMATFDGPARAIRCATTIVEGVRSLGLELRAGLHTGECEIIDSKIAGIAVHIASRVAATAAPGQVLVSSTVHDLVAGSRITFADAGEHSLKGVPGLWRLFRVG